LEDDMSDRDIIFKKIRAGLDSSANDGKRRASAEARIKAEFRHPIPERVAGKTHAQHLTLMRGFLEGQGATVLDAASRDDIPGLVAKYLRDTNLPAQVRFGDDALLSGLPWSKEASVTLTKGRAEASDEVGLSHAAACVAETGTLVMASGPDNPVTINFLPENHIVVVETKDVLGPYEDAWAKIRARFGKGVMPRTVNMISGPSRTGDIGGRLVMGAHGPRRLCVIVVRG
jgi:L-lactate dehydrogenase complex protein LldG